SRPRERYRGERHASEHRVQLRDYVVGPLLLLETDEQHALDLVQIRAKRRERRLDERAAVDLDERLEGIAEAGALPRQRKDQRRHGNVLDLGLKAARRYRAIASCAAAQWPVHRPPGPRSRAGGTV